MFLFSIHVQLCLSRMCISSLHCIKYVNWLVIQGSRPLCIDIGSIDLEATSTNTTPSSSRRPSPPSSSFPSPVPSYQPTPSSSSFPSPSRLDAKMSSNPFLFMRQSYNPSLPPLRISNSAPVTPPLSPPITNISMQNFNWESIAKQSASLKFPFLAASCPASPTRGQRFTPVTIPECDESDSTIDSGQWIDLISHWFAHKSPHYNMFRSSYNCWLQGGIILVLSSTSSLWCLVVYIDCQSQKIIVFDLKRFNCHSGLSSTT